uniref:Uncharacterized protein n=1 Tax=Arundo donax TaxID=35708 RepID=A0A0A9G3T2_ARUDO
MVVVAALLPATG